MRYSEAISELRDLGRDLIGGDSMPATREAFRSAVERFGSVLESKREAFKAIGEEQVIDVFGRVLKDLADGRIDEQKAMQSASSVIGKVAEKVMERRKETFARMKTEVGMGIDLLSRHRAELPEGVAERLAVMLESAPKNAMALESGVNLARNLKDGIGEEMSGEMRTKLKAAAGNWMDGASVGLDSTMTMYRDGAKPGAVDSYDHFTVKNGNLMKRDEGGKLLEIVGTDGEAKSYVKDSAIEEEANFEAPKI